MMHLTPKPTINYKQLNAHGTPTSTGSGSFKMNVDKKRSPILANTDGTDFRETTSGEEHAFRYSM